MKKRLHPHSLVRLATLSVTTLLLVVPLVAQTDLKIMVSGPWAYVAKTSDKTRIFLVAPKSTHHNGYIFPGTNAADFGNQVPYMIGTGLYELDFDPSLRVTYIPTPQEATMVLAATVSDLNKINAILSNASNYVISLPVPDDYSTYVDPLGKFDGYSESKVDLGKVTPSTPPRLYTTWMVLHYSVKTLPDSLHQAGQANKSIATQDSSGKARGGISIVLGDPSIDDEDLVCDSISLASFNAQNSLWGLSEQARFPELDTNRKQTHRYNYDCTDNIPYTNLMKRAEKAEKNEGKKLNEHKESGGGGDCRASQLSINKAGPPVSP